MKHATKRLAITLTFATMLVPCVAYAGAHHPGHGCSNATFYGAYGMNLTGTWPQGAVIDVGVAVADGAGKLTGTNTISLGGAIYPGVPFTGTYSVAQNCILTATFSAPGFPTVNVSGTITNAGYGIDIVETDAGTSVGGSATATLIY